MQRIAIVDYGMGNLRSVSKALEHVVDEDTEVIVTSDESIITNSDRVVCPGQGAAKDCMSQLQACEMDKAVRKVIGAERPFMGICMGLQVLLSFSDENDGTECLNIIPGKVRRFADPLTDSEGQRLKVPHMGWSKVTQSMSHAMWSGIESDSRFYFCHSYYVTPDDATLSAGECTYGNAFTAVVARNNIFACQFHPEKSAKDGLQLLANFSVWDGKHQNDA